MISRADLHLHTTCSDGHPTPEELVDWVREENKLQVIAVTDHNTIEGGLRARNRALSTSLEVVIGSEISSKDGHILGLWLERNVPAGLSAAMTVDKIHEQGGIAVGPHPFWLTGKLGLTSPPHGVGILVALLPFDGIEVENSTPGLGLANLRARRLNRQLGLPALAASDAHILPAIGRAYTTFPGRGQEALRNSIVSRTCQPHHKHYSTKALLGYAQWGFNHTKIDHASAVASEA